LSEKNEKNKIIVELQTKASEQKEIMDQMIKSSDDKKHVVELESKAKKLTEQMKTLYGENVNIRKDFDRQEFEMEKLRKKAAILERENVMMR
jgi:predicted nuclease with TOPRIM domain